MNYSKASDKRRFLRYEMLDYALVFATEIDQPVKAVIVDIGLGGLQFRSKEEVPVGLICKIQIGRMNGDPLILAGEIRHVSDIPGSDLIATGVKFCPETHEERLAIAEYVHGVFQRQCDKLLI